VNACLMKLFTNPGRYWFQASSSEVGFLRQVLAIAEARRFTATEPKAAQMQSALANYFLRRS
jgi:hypothetical protein